MNLKRYTAIVVLCLCGVAWGQTKKETTVTKETTRDGTTVSTSYQKSSEVLGRPITTNNENIGKVEDLMVDVNSGRVVYGIGTFTNVEGTGGRLYPIPWPAGTYSTSTHTYNLNVEPDRLPSAPSFTRTEWPSFTDDEFVTRTYKTYNQTPYWQTKSTVVRTSDRPVTTYTERWTQEPTSMHRMSELRGRTIVTSDGTRLGEVNEVVLDPQDGRILYGVTTRDGQSIPIPWSAFRAKGNDFELSITADRWKTAPVIETTRWTTLNDPHWSTQVYRYYEVEPIVDTDDDD